MKLLLLLSLLVPARAETPAVSTPTAHGDHAGEMARARKALEGAVLADPSNFQLWLHLAFVQHKMADLDAAQVSFEKVTALNPQESAAHYMLALIYEKKGQKDKAISAWKACEATSKDPNLLSIAEKHLKELTK